MAPRMHRTAPSLPTRPARRAPARSPATVEESGEDFDLADIESDGDDDLLDQADEPTDSPAATITTADDIDINIIHPPNDPEPPPSRKRKRAEDIHYFFETNGDYQICKECR